MGIADDLQGLAQRLAEPLRGIFVAWDSRSSGAKVSYSTTQSIAHATVTTLTFDTQRYDYGDYWDAGAATRLTPPVDGTYLITGSVRFASNATGERRLYITTNAGVTPLAIQQVPADSATVTLVSIAAISFLTAGQYVQLQVYQNTGGNLNVDSSSAYSPEFAIARV